MRVVKSKRRGWYRCPICDEPIYRVVRFDRGKTDWSGLFQGPGAREIELADSVTTVATEDGTAVRCSRRHRGSLIIL